METETEKTKSGWMINGVPSERPPVLVIIGWIALAILISFVFYYVMNKAGLWKPMIKLQKDFDVFIQRIFGRYRGRRMLQRMPRFYAVKAPETYG